MAYSKSARVIEARSADLDYDEVGPGLYDDETVYELDSGDLVAVSIHKNRHPQSQGYVFHCWVRAIDEDGQTLVDGGGELEIEHVHSIDVGSALQRDPDLFAMDLIDAMLGEDNQLNLSDELGDAINVRNALRSSKAAEGKMKVDALLDKVKGKQTKGAV